MRDDNLYSTPTLLPFSKQYIVTFPKQVVYLGQAAPGSFLIPADSKTNTVLSFPESVLFPHSVHLELRAPASVALTFFSVSYCFLFLCVLMPVALHKQVAGKVCWRNNRFYIHFWPEFLCNTTECSAWVSVWKVQWSSTIPWWLFVRTSSILTKKKKLPLKKKLPIFYVYKMIINIFMTSFF